MQYLAHEDYDLEINQIIRDLLNEYLTEYENDDLTAHDVEETEHLGLQRDVEIRRLERRYQQLNSTPL